MRHRFEVSIVIEYDLRGQRESSVMSEALPGVLTLKGVLGQMGPNQARRPLQALLDDAGAKPDKVREHLLTALTRLHDGQLEGGPWNSAHWEHFVHVLQKKWDRKINDGISPFLEFRQLFSVIRILTRNQAHRRQINYS